MTFGKLVDLFLSPLLCSCGNNNRTHPTIASIKQDDVCQVPGTHSIKKYLVTLLFLLLLPPHHHNQMTRVDPQVLQSDLLCLPDSLLQNEHQ